MLPEIFLKTTLEGIRPLLPCMWGHGAELSHICVPYTRHHSRESPAYLFDEGCCLQAAFAISHLILELLPQLLEVVRLPQNVLLAHKVLLAQLPAPPHHICTYGPVGIALCFESLAEG